MWNVCTLGGRRQCRASFILSRLTVNLPYHRSTEALLYVFSFEHHLKDPRLEVVYLRPLFRHHLDYVMPLHRVQVTYEFCVDAADTQSTLDVFNREHTRAIDDRRCAVVGEVLVDGVASSAQFEEDTLDEVPLNALDDTLRERLMKEDGAAG